MRERELDELFERYRTKGDASALGRVFDELVPEFHRIAAHLTRNRQAAEDLVQTTFLAAIESREQWDGRRGVTPWLAGILMKNALHARRKASRVPNADLLAQREASEPSREAELAELRYGLNEALRYLPSRYRQVLTLHFREDMTAREIAHDLGRTPGAVRVQIHRGLSMLRRVYIRAFVARGTIIPSIRPQIRPTVRAAVMKAAARPPASQARQVAGPTVTEVVVTPLYTTSALIAASLAGAVLLGLLALRWAPGSVERIRTAVDRTLAVAAPHEPETLAGSDLSTPDSARREAAPSAAPATVLKGLDDPGWIVSGEIRFDRPRRLDQVRLTVHSLLSGNYSDGVDVPGTSGDDGRFVIDVSEKFSHDLGDRVIQLVLRAEHPECAAAEIVLDVESERRVRRADAKGPWSFEAIVQLSAAAVVTGRVLIPDSAPLSGALVGLIPLLGGRPQGPRPLDLVETARDGKFRLRGSQGGPYAVAVVADGLQPAVRELVLKKDAEASTGDILLSRGSHIAGTVRLLGQPVPAGTRVRTWAHRTESFVGSTTLHFGDSFVTWIEGRLTPPLLNYAETDGRGAFHFEGLEAGPHQLRVDNIPGVVHVISEPIDVDVPNDSLEIDLAFSRLQLSVRDQGGPLGDVGCQIQAGWETGGSRSLRTDLDGSAVLLVPATRAYTVHVEREGYAEQTLEVVAPAAGEERLIEIEIERFAAALVLNVNGPGMTRPTHALIGLFALPEGGLPQSEFLPDYGRPSLVRELAAQNGRLMLDNLPAGRFEVLVLTLDHPLLYRAQNPGELRSRFVGELADPHRSACHGRLIVDLVHGLPLEQPVELSIGGWIRLTDPEPTGPPTSVTCALRTLEGGPIPVLLWNKEPDELKRYGGSSLQSGRASPTWIFPALPVGTYEIELTRDEKHTTTERIDVVPRGIKNVSICPKIN